jgi:hypothetical protein
LGTAPNEDAQAGDQFTPEPKKESLANGKWAVDRNELPAFRRVFEDAIKLLVTKEQAEKMVNSLIRIANSEKTGASQAIAAITVLMERLEGKAPPSREELDNPNQGVRVVVLPSVGQRQREPAIGLPEFVEDGKE